MQNDIRENYVAGQREGLCDLPGPLLDLLFRFCEEKFLESYFSERFPGFACLAAFCVLLCPPKQPL